MIAAARCDEALRRATGAGLGELYGVRRVDHRPPRTEWRRQDDHISDRVGVDDRRRGPYRDWPERHGDTDAGRASTRPWSLRPTDGPRAHHVFRRTTRHARAAALTRASRSSSTSSIWAQLPIPRREPSRRGRRVKVALAGALVHKPQHLILDEPTSGLDVMSTRALHALLRSLRDEGACVLFSSHVMHEVAMLCDRVVMLADGRIAAAGAPDEVLERHGVSSLEELVVAVSRTSSDSGGS